MSNKAAQPRRRLSPDARRRQIVEVARALFAQRREEPVSTADVAAAAGVTRALVHHYFHGIEELRDAVAMEIVRSAVGMLGSAPELPIEQRVPANVSALLDAVHANRDAWLATVGGEGGASTPAGRALREAMLARMLINNADTIDDTPWARLCVKGYIGFCDAVIRDWVLGQGTREEAQYALSATALHLLRHTIPEGSATVGPRS